MWDQWEMSYVLKKVHTSLVEQFLDIQETFWRHISSFADQCADHKFSVVKLILNRRNFLIYVLIDRKLGLEFGVRDEYLQLFRNLVNMVTKFCIKCKKSKTRSYKFNVFLTGMCLTIYLLHNRHSSRLTCKMLL